MALLADRVGRLDTENAFKIGPLIAGLEASGHRVIKCNLGEPDFPLPGHVRDEIKRQLDLDNTHYSDPQGILPLRRAVARSMGADRGLSIEAERVVVFPGAKPPIGLCQQTYCDPGDEVIYPSPGFPIYESFIRYVGAIPVPMHLREEEGFTVRPQDLERLISERTKLIILNFPSNPTGGVATREQLAGLAEVIRDRAPAECRVYSDEVYEHILFEGSLHHSIASEPGMAERTIIVSGVSKSYCFTGGRVGWAVFPTEDEAAHFKNLNINYYSCMPAYTQEGARIAIESPLSPDLIRSMCREFQRRRDVVLAGLNAIDGVRCQKPMGAFYVFPNISGVCDRLGIQAAFERLSGPIRAKSSPATLFQRFLLFRHHVATMDRRSFGRLGSDGLHYLRISVATSMEDLEVAVERLARACRDEAGFHSFVAERYPLTAARSAARVTAADSTLGGKTC